MNRINAINLVKLQIFKITCTNDSSIYYTDEQQQRLIREAMADYHKHTCIKFKPYTGEESDYIRITAGKTGCWSSVGRIGGPQDVNLQVPGCVTKKGTVIHELMHAVGFLHEQSRYERDEFVRINYQNIQSGELFFLFASLYVAIIGYRLEKIMTLWRISFFFWEICVLSKYREEIFWFVFLSRISLKEGSQRRVDWTVRGYSTCVYRTV